MSKSVFRSAIEGDDGRVDAGYLALFWTMAVTVSAIPIVVMSGAILAWRSGPEQVASILQSAGVAVTAICGGCGVVIGAVGAFRLGDKPHAGTTTTSVTATEKTVTPT